MCGISGILSPNQKIPLFDLKLLSDELSHRGPDDEGYSIYDSGKLKSYKGIHTPGEIKLDHITDHVGHKFNLGISHRRFSIIETSSLGHQPLVSQDGLSLSFNGEIYNYLELRDEISKKTGLKFKTKSDTEVILESYRLWGLDCFKKFNGFWAIAIIENGKLILSRDRIGKKPLYYSDDNNILIFSSEIRPILKLRKKYGLKTNISSIAAFDYLHLDRRNAFTDSMFSEIKQIEPSSYMIYESNCVKEIKKHLFWKLKPTYSENDITLKESKNKFLDILNDSIKIRLRSDVPIDLNLSGGLDSSAIAALASENLRAKGDNLSVHNFKFKEDYLLDESKEAKLVAEFCNAKYSEIILDKNEIFSSIDDFIYKSEEPVHSLASIVQNFAWGEIAKKGFKVILHGSANDELMLGYDYLKKIEILNRLKKLNLNLLSKDLINEPASIIKLLKWILFDKPPKDSFNMLSNDLIFINSERNLNYLENLKKFNKSTKERMRQDLVSLRVPYWCNLMDKNMMSIPVEVRMPFLDYRLVEFLTSTPTKFLLSNGYTKYLLRYSFKGKLPNSILWNKKKVGFSIPKKAWHENLKKPFFEILENEDLEEFFDINKLRKNVENLSEDRFWRFYNFSKWLTIIK